MSSATASAPALTPATGMSDRKAGVWAGLTSFFLMWSFLYIVLVVFRPNWVCVATPQGDVLVVDPAMKASPAIDQGRAFVVALIVTLVIMLIAWLVMATAGSRS